ncbi:MAG: helix-turn-helix domain-containing protein [Cyanobacteria bacterium]|nr:helix-turn-helix domain-containing protein [Cyanobacteriota bacterium]MDW8199817.1 helix-turn-helix domain-containing protein [Cyanobacteriota bacterium SKYGB_h_bin112]
MKSGSKYQPLLDYLRRSDQLVVTLTLAEIETILGSNLPKSAYYSRGWWGNRAKGALQASAWMDAGYLVDTIDLERQQITFRRPPSVYKAQRQGDTIVWTGELIKALRMHMGITQMEFAATLGVRQQTVSEWETNAYTPTRASSKHLMLVAEQCQFKYEVDSVDGNVNNS